MKRPGAKDAAVPAAAQHHPRTSRTQPGPVQDPGKGRAERAPHLLSAARDSTSCTPRCCPFSSFQSHGEREERLGRCLSSHRDTHEGGRDKGEPSRSCSRATGPPWRWPWPPASPSGLLQLLLPYRWENVCESLLGNTCEGISQLEHCVQIFIC